jgi:hypothetical protein
MPDLQLRFTTTTAVIVLCVAAAACISFLFYRYTLPAVSRGRRVLLALIRTGALSLLLLLLFEPLLTVISSSSQFPLLAVLVDNTQSMRIVDATGDRAATLRAALRSPSLERLASHADVRYFTFDVGLHSLVNPRGDTLSLDRQATDISEALRALAKEQQAAPLNAVLLLSDGNYNLGLNPLYDAERLGVPLYAVGIGDSSEQRDVMISSVAANTLVYADAAAPVDVTVKSTGYAGEHVEVTLNEGSRQLDRATVELSAATREYALHFSYTPEGEGMKKYAVRVSSLPGELTEANNQRAFYTRVLKSKLRVVILAGFPGPDDASIRQTLTERKSFTVRSFVERPEGQFYGTPPSRAILDSADCIVLINFPTSGTAPATLELVRNAANVSRRPILYFGGKEIDYARLQSIGDPIPFAIEQISSAEQLVDVDPDPSQRSHPLLLADAPGGADLWKKLPPVYRTLTTCRAKPGAVILCRSKLQNVPLTDPFLIARSLGGQKSVAVLGYGVWRWRLMAQGSNETEGFFPLFLSTAIQWLTTPEEKKPVKVSTMKEVYSQGEPIDILGQVYDATARPVDGAQVHVTAQHGGESFETDLHGTGNGRYEGALEGLGEGEYTYRATATSGGTPLGEDAGRFTVGGLNLEFQDTRMNAPLLREVTFRTGGKFLVPGDIDSLDEILAHNPGFTPRETHHTRRIELWNWKYLLAILLLLLTAEWFIRKRSGML